jgi:hypothetical protein
MGSPSSANLAPGALTPQDTWGNFNNLSFVIQQALLKLQTATLVRVESCTNNGDLSPVGFVDVTPLVNQIDGNGNATPHVTIYGLPYLRVQGGTNAIIIDPQAGDIGIAVFASRDISKVKATKSVANPGSFRTFDFADGLYVGGVLNATPQKYILFDANGIRIAAPDQLTLTAPTITLDGDVTITGDATSNGVSLRHHKHTSASAGQPTSEPIVTP